MNLDETYTRLTSDRPPEELLHVGKPFALAAALGLLSQIEQLPLMALSYSGKDFAIAYPGTAIPARAEPHFGGELTRYLAWRRLMLDVFLSGTRKPVDADAIDGVMRLARLLIGPNADDCFYTLRVALAPGETPVALDRHRALVVDEGIDDHQRPAYRRSLRVLDLLQDHPLAHTTGLLPKAIISLLPHPSRHDTDAPLPPILAQVFQAAPADVRAALPFTYRLAVLLNLVDASADIALSDLTSDHVINALRVIDPRNHGFTRPSRETLALYLSRIMRHGGAELPAGRVVLDPCKRDWAECRKILKTRGETRLASNIGVIAALAVAENRKPAELTPDWFAAKLAEAGPKRKAVRSSTFAVDALHDLEGFLVHLRPPRNSGLTRERGGKDRQITQSTPALPRKDPVTEAWAAFFRDMRDCGLDDADLNSVSAIRTAAVESGRRPDQINREFCVSLLDSATTSGRSKIHLGAQILDRVATIEALAHVRPGPPIGPLPDGRTIHPDLPRAIAAELTSRVQEIGYGASIRRALNAAAKAVLAAAEKVGLLPARDLADLLRYDLEHLAPHMGPEPQAGRHRGYIRALRQFIELEWTDDWKSLYAAIRDLGTKSAANPVPTLFRYADGRAPRDLTAVWRDGVNRKLRRPNPLSIHGRADLARTFSANLGRLEGFRDQLDPTARALLPRDSLLEAA